MLIKKHPPKQCRPSRALGGHHGGRPDQVIARIALLLIGTSLLLAACAAGPNELARSGPDPAGFWLGLWHGLISPITFVISLFSGQVNIYEVHNNGGWYDWDSCLVWLARSAAAGGQALQEGGVRGSAPAASRCRF